MTTIEHHSTRRTAARRRPGFSAFPLLTTLLLPLAACDSTTDPNDHNGHDDFGRVEIQTRGQASALLAVWTVADGWRDASGNPITELPNPRDEEGVGLIPLRAGGPPASLTVRFFDPDGSEIPMGTASRDDDPPRERTCTAEEARYVSTITITNVIAWPNMRHPDSPSGPFHWAERSDGSVVGLFHCDHVHIYPENLGSVPITFVLWHGDHADGETDPISIRVELAN